MSARRVTQTRGLESRTRRRRVAYRLLMRRWEKLAARGILHPDAMRVERESLERSLRVAGELAAAHVGVALG